MSQIQILLVGLKTQIKETYLVPLNDVLLHSCDDKEGLKILMTKKKSLDFNMVVCGSEFTGMAMPELAQTLRMLYPTAKMIYAVDSPGKIDRKLYLKNGFNEVFLLPLDENLLKVSLEKYLAEAEEELYSAVRLVDIGPGTQLDFELRVFLNRNNKFVSYSAVGDVLDEPRLERLKLYRVATVFVPIEQLHKFYDYSASRLMVLSGQHSGMPEVERAPVLRNSVKELINGVLNDSYAKSKGLSTGKKVIEHTKKIIDQYLTLKHPGDWFRRVMLELDNKAESYSHTSSVCTYAVLFSMVLGLGNAQDLATAALLHDLGLADMPAKFRTAPYEEMTPEEQYIFRGHPERSLKAVHARRLVISDGAARGILQHHEKWDGNGFPKNLKGSEFSVEGQILAVANRFEHLTRIQGNQAPMSPEQAMKAIAVEARIEPRLLEALAKMFEKETVHQIT